MMFSRFLKKLSHNIKNIEMPHTGVLVLAAICISVIAISLSFQIKTSREKFNLSNNIIAEAGTSESSLAADKRIAAALAETQQDILGSLSISSNPFEPNPKDTLSDSFTKNIVSAYSKYQYSGATDLNGLSNSAVNNLDTSSLPQKRYSIKDIKIYVPTNNNEIKEYGNMFAKNYLTALAPVVNAPSKYSGDISAIGEIYKQISKNLLEMKVPNEVAINHLQVINDFSLMADTFPLINGQEKDPVKALLGLRLVQDSMTNVPQMFIQINKYFKQNAIIFDKSEPGSIWNQVPDAIPESANSGSASNGGTSGNLFQ